MNDKQILLEIFQLTSQIVQKANNLEHEDLKVAIWNTTRNLETTILSTVLRWNEFYNNSEHQKSSS
jgi:hypothetical protein